MYSDAIKTLYEEHEKIEQRIAGTRQLLESKNGLPSAEKLLVDIRFYRNFGDSIHHHKEEEILFPALTEANEMMAGIIGELEEHHAEFRKYLSEAEHMVLSQKIPDAIRLLGEYLELLEEHIAVENDELFVSAEDLLSENELETIYFRFCDFDRELNIENISK